MTQSPKTLFFQSPSPQSPPLSTSPLQPPNTDVLSVSTSSSPSTPVESPKSIQAQPGRLRWTRVEETRLVDLVRKHGSKNWDLIQQLLGTRRTTQSVSHKYYRLTGKKNDSAAETMRLDSSSDVDDDGDDGDYDWKKGRASLPLSSAVVASVRKRGNTRRIQSSDERFSASDDEKILSATKNPSYISYRDEFDTQHYHWNAVAKEVFDSRFTSTDLLHRYERHLHPNLKKTPWSQEDDLLLLRLIAAKGERFSIVSKAMNNSRYDLQCRNRYIAIRRRLHGEDSSPNELLEKYTSTMKNSNSGSNGHSAGHHMEQKYIVNLNDDDDSSEDDSSEDEVSSTLTRSRVSAAGDAEYEASRPAKRIRTNSSSHNNNSSSADSRKLILKVSRIERDENDNEVSQSVKLVPLPDQNFSLAQFLEMLFLAFGVKIILSKRVGGKGSIMQYTDVEGDSIDVHSEFDWQLARDEFKNLVSRDPMTRPRIRILVKC